MDTREIEAPTNPRRLHPLGGRPTWKAAYVLPPQGSWTTHDYFSLESFADYPRVELADGRLEVLPMPTEAHDLIMIVLLEALNDFVQVHAPGVVLFSGMKIRLKKSVLPGSGLRASEFRRPECRIPEFRVPDVAYLKTANAHRRHDRYWDGADLVMEVVCGDDRDRERDLVKKPEAYAAAGIPEYWIVEPDESFIRVLTLDGTSYKLHGEFRSGELATSVLLPGFSVSVDAVLAATQ
jgi:Uma2 family endonuclease